MIIIIRKKYETYIRSIKSFIKKYKGKEMNKYLTIYEELKNNAGKKIKINWFNHETKRFENEIGILKKYKYNDKFYFICNDFKFAGIIPICVKYIELIEEDKKIVDESTAGCCINVNEGETIQPADNINHPSHYQGKIENLEKQNKEKADEINKLKKEIERLTKILKKGF